MKLYRKYYGSPEVTIEFIRTEHSFAAGSAAVTPVNANQQIQQEWETGPDETRTLTW